ncbi:MAG: tetratricopeptide repeat protein [Polyangiaceae bacterium]
MPRNAWAGTCPASTYTAKAFAGTTDPKRARDQAILEAGVLATQAASQGPAARYGDARAIYLAVLARDPDDAEALYGLGRIDAWEGCWPLAERSYKRALALRPDDADMRAALIDLFTWEGRYDDAERLLAEGLARAPDSPALLARRARFAYFRGDADAAIASMDAAIARAPGDQDLTAMRERFFVHEARVTAHLDRYPDPYQDIAWVRGQYLRRLRRYEIYGGAELVERAGGEAQAVYDARFPFGVLYHPGIGATVGGEITPGAPGNAVPDVALRGFALVPVLPRLSAFFAYSFWHFAGGALVNTVQPAIGVALPREVRVDVRAWISALNLPATGDLNRPGQTKLAAAVGPAVEWAVTPRATLGAYYTYGAELDKNPVRYQLLTFETHSFGATANVRLNQTFGVAPLLGVSRRVSPTSDEAIWIGTVELGAYARF